MGSNDDMPAFRWMEKENNRVFISNRPRHAAEIERRHSNGKGLLFADGASRGNIFTGDAEDSVLTMASAGRKHGRIGAGYYAYFSHPYTTMRTVIGVIAEASREIRQASQQRRRDVRPRVHRGGVYPLLRSFTTVITRDVIVATLIGDMKAGRSVMYADFVGYDEVSHHSGVERYDALETLRRLDREFARLQRAAATMKRRYEFVVLSDHGQSQGATFLARYGESLGDLVAAHHRSPDRERRRGRHRGGRGVLGLRRRRAGGDRRRTRDRGEGRGCCLEGQARRVRRRRHRRQAGGPGRERRAGDRGRAQGCRHGVRQLRARLPDPRRHPHDEGAHRRALSHPARHPAPAPGRGVPAGPLRVPRCPRARRQRRGRARDRRPDR